uniref:Uncharacterized protein n=1 Tax=Noctiluca scintillans TaxID=2966 RepID=A0A7S1AH62_NOCSC
MDSMVYVLPMPLCDADFPFHRMDCSLDEQPVYRKWIKLVDVCCLSPQIPGLTDALKDAGLAAYISKAEQWCESTGAAFLEEVLEEIHAICEFLELDKVSRFTLYMALNKQIFLARPNALQHIESASTSLSH